MCRFAFLMLLLTVLRAGVAGAEWDYWNAEETRLLDGSFKENTDEYGTKYVIVVGMPDNPEVVRASDIEDALLEGKEIRVKMGKD